MRYIVFEKYIKEHYCKSKDLGWFARFRIQFLSDHILIRSCLVCVCMYVCMCVCVFVFPCDLNFHFLH